MLGAQKRLGELNALMAADNFWSNREQAQKLIEESNSLRDKVEPLLKAEKKLEDFHVMVELGEAVDASVNWALVAVRQPRRHAGWAMQQLLRID